MVGDSGGKQGERKQLTQRHRGRREAEGAWFEGVRHGLRKAGEGELDGVEGVMARFWGMAGGTRVKSKAPGVKPTPGAPGFSRDHPVIEDRRRQRTA